MTTLTLSAGVYTLNLQAQVSHYTWVGGNAEVGDRACSNTYWSGLARLSNGSSDIVFNFETRKHREISSNQIGLLEDEFVVISGISENATIANTEEILIEFFEALWEKVWNEFNNQKENNKLFFITTTPSSIDGRPFVNKGIIIEPGHQMEILTD